MDFENRPTDEIHRIIQGYRFYRIHSEEPAYRQAFDHYSEIIALAYRELRRRYLG